MIAAFGAASLASPRSVSALVDTGAASTVITPEKRRFSASAPSVSQEFNTPTTLEPVLCRQFHLNIYFSREFAIEDILAIEAPLTGQAVQCLLGRDVLSHGVLTYSGVENLFRLTF